MAKNVVLILEYGDGGYSCYNDEPLGNYAVIDGDGATAEEAKAYGLIDEVIAHR